MCTSVDEAAAVMTGSGISGIIYFSRVGPNNISINTTDLLGLNGLYMYTPIEKTAADLPLSRIMHCFIAHLLNRLVRMGVRTHMLTFGIISVIVVTLFYPQPQKSMDGTFTLNPSTRVHRQTGGVRRRDHTTTRKTFDPPAATMERIATQTIP